MNAADRVRIRFADALFSAVFSIIVAALVGGLTRTSIDTGTVFSSEVSAILLSLEMLPLGLTLLGLGVATFRAGPFGFIGFLFEWAGAATFFADARASALWGVAFGAAIVVVGAFVWSWKPVIRWVVRRVLRQRRPRHPRRPPL